MNEVIKCEYPYGLPCHNEAASFFRKRDFVIAYCEFHTPVVVNGYRGPEFIEITKEEYIVEDCIWRCDV